MSQASAPRWRARSDEPLVEDVGPEAWAAREPATSNAPEPGSTTAVERGRHTRAHTIIRPCSTHMSGSTRKRREFPMARSPHCADPALMARNEQRLSLIFCFAKMALVGSLQSRLLDRRCAQLPQFNSSGFSSENDVGDRMCMNEPRIRNVRVKICGTQRRANAD